MAGGAFTLEGRFWPGAAPPWHALTLLIKNPQMGRVVLDPAPRNVDSPTFPADTDVTLTAEPNDSKVFKKWKVWDANDPNTYRPAGGKSAALETTHRQIGS